MTSRFKLIPALVAVATLTACTPESRNTDPDVSVARGEMLFFQKCAACHGDDGKGAGRESLGLGAPPPDLTTLSAQNRGIFPQNFVMSVIDGFNRRHPPDSEKPESGTAARGPGDQVEGGGVSAAHKTDLIALAAYLETIQR